MKKTKYLVAALLLMGATTTFTSCIDNDEPAGITELRGAKAELLKAKAVVEQARAQKILAEAEYQKALAATEQANAKYREAEAKFKEAQAEAEAARTEEEKARVEASIAYYKNLMEEQALIHQTAMVNYQKALAEAQRQYDLVIKQIEIAEAIMSDQDKVTVAYLKNEVNKAYAIIYGGTYYKKVAEDGTVNEEDLETIYNHLKEDDATIGKLSKEKKYSLNSQIFTASEALYDAMKNKVSGEGDFSDLYVPQLELNLEYQKANLAAKENKKAKIQAFLDGSIEGTDWNAKVAELRDSIDILNDKTTELKIAVKEAQASPEYMKAQQEYKGIDANGEIGKINATVSEIKNYKQKGTAQELTLAKNELNKVLDATNGTEATVKEFKVETTGKVIELVNAKLPSGSAVTAFEISELKGKGLYELTETGTIEAKGQLKDNVEKIESWVKAAGDASASVNDAAQAEYELKRAKEELETAKKGNESATEKWQASIKASNGELKATDQIVLDTKDEMEKAVEAYNKAVSVLKSAVDTYNTTFETIYDEGYKAGEAEFTAELTAKIYREEDLPTGNGATTVQDFFNKLANDELIASPAPDWTNQALKTETFAMSLIGELMKAKDPSVEAAKITEQQNSLKEKVTFVVNPYLTGEDGTDDMKVAATAKAEDAINKAYQTVSGKDGKLLAADKSVTKAISGDAKNGLNATFDAIGTAETSWKSSDGDLSLYFAMKPKASNKAFATVAKYDVAGVKTEKATGTISAIVKKYTVKVDDITSAEFDSCTDVEIDATKKDAALANGSKLVFGSNFNNRYVAVSEEEMRETYTTPDALKAAGTFGYYLSCSDAVKSIEERISAAEDLKKVVEDLTKMLSDYKAEIESVKTATYGEEIKGYEDAVKANNQAKEAFEAEKLKVDEVRLELSKVELQIDALEAVATRITNAIKKYLDINGSLDYEKFEEDLESALFDAKQEVIYAQQQVAKAEADLKEAQEGKYDSVAKAQRTLDDLMVQLEAAQKNYDAALANLETALEIMAKTAE